MSERGRGEEKDQVTQQKGSPKGQEEGFGSYRCMICFLEMIGKSRVEERGKECGEERGRVHCGRDESALQTSSGFRMIELCKAFLI